jgi:hypothetical protein
MCWLKNNCNKWIINNKRNNLTKLISIIRTNKDIKNNKQILYLIYNN